MHNNKQKKSLGFLSIVAFMMILVGVVYTVSGVFATNVSATISTPSPSEETIPSISNENLFASLEKQVANKATSLRNEVLGTPTSSTTEESPSFSEVLPTPATSVASISLADPRPLPEVFDDIHDSRYKDAILVLYSNGLLQKANSYHPKYHVRISDFIRVVMDTYRLKQ
ncbi:MAG: hypothetical protein LBO09_05010 [Candidatus Peribacteria bacterium]|nr:hypothetical protein [Candidatus Peribacteria bacterium]